MLGDNIIYQIVYMMAFLPAVVLTSKVCPENMEVRARVTSQQNLVNLCGAMSNPKLVKPSRTHISSIASAFTNETRNW